MALNTQSFAVASEKPKLEEGYEFIVDEKGRMALKKKENKKIKVEEPKKKKSKKKKV